MNKNNIEILDKSLCTGCGLCKNKCPVNAISMESDKEGFLAPIVSQKCIDCGICVKFCPQLNKEINYNKANSVYAVWCKDKMRNNSSSGGVFGAIANYVLDNNGVVYGARFDEEYKYLSHVEVTSKQQLNPILKSKYVQSDMGAIYADIQANAVANKLTVFCGCPCQVQAVKNYLKKDYDNVVLIDILCHGVPSPMAYNKFIEEINPNHEKIEKVDFRDKKYGWGKLISADFENSDTHYDYHNGNYFRAFLSGLSMRECCFSCKYAQPDRVGDITLGDFWGVKNISQNLDDGKGTSLVMCNNAKGENILQAIDKYIIKKEQVSLEQTIEISKRANGALIRPTWEPQMRKCFFNHLQKDSFSKSLRYAETSLLDVGLLGWWNQTDRSNYGSTLTNFALYKFILSLGLSVAFVSPPNFDRVNAGSFNLKHRYRMTAKYPEKDMAENNKYIDTYIVGSDVLWYYDAFIKSGYFFLLDFASDNKRKISYSTSFGNTNRFFPKKEMLKVKSLLSRFDSVGVRELEGVEICKNRFSINATQVLDPVFICDKKEWADLINAAERKTEKGFVFAYMLDPTVEKAENIASVTKLLNLNLITITDKQFNAEEKQLVLENYGLLNNATIEELLYHIQNSEFVITDSYHGMCFSLIFEKPFAVLINRSRGASRFETLSEIFGISPRLVDSLSEVVDNIDLFKNFDYSSLSNIIETEINRSKDWLISAITAPKENKVMSEVELLTEEVLELKKIVKYLQSKLEVVEDKKS